MTLPRIALVFTVLSLLGFGGGNAIIPQMHADVVDKYHWITSVEFTRFYALGKLSPGPTTTMGALVGYAVDGFAGALVATLAVFVPAALLVFALGHVWRRFKDHPLRQRFAVAIKPVVLGLLWAGVVTLARGALDGPLTIGLALIATLVMLRTEWNQALLVLGAGAIGAVFLR
jgi:chromate transporter